MNLYYNCRIIDGTGAEAIEDAALVTDKDKIVFVGKASDKPDKVYDEIIDMGGRTILPGLFNCHVHMCLRFPFNSYYYDECGNPGYRAMVMYRRAIEALFCGVTTIRCTGESDYSDTSVRNAINKGMVFGPRILTAGPIIIAHGGHGAGQWGSIECSGPYEFMRETRKVINHGVDLVKICTTGGMVGEYEGAGTMQMTEEEIKAVTSIAAKYNKVVAGHIGNDEAIRAAVRCGVLSIEHGYMMNKETAKILADSDAFLVPTLAVSAACDYLEEHNNPRYHIEKIREIGPKHMQSAANAIEAGAKIAIGTDLLPSDPLDGTNATIREVELVAEAGLTNLQAINAATLNSAKLCRVDNETGSLEVGKDADIIAVCGKPDQNIKDLRNVEMVVRKGTPVLSKITGDSRQCFSPLAFNGVPSGASFINW